MPEMDGYAATKAIRSESRFDHIPIIAMTAHALAEVRDRCTNKEMQDYLSKPINPYRLFETLTRWLEPSPAISASMAQAALRHLCALLDDDSADSVDFFDSIRARLALLLDPTSLHQLGRHLAQNEFDAARKLLAQQHDAQN
jgi:CheY-like chemotaxis protein